MFFESLVGAIVAFFRDFDATKALQLAYYSVALVGTTYGLVKAIRFAEKKMPKRLLEFVTRSEGRLLQDKLKALDRVRHAPALSSSNSLVDFQSELAQALKCLDRGRIEDAASLLDALAVRLNEKVRVTAAQLKLTQQQAAAVFLLFGTLATKVPQRTDQSEAAFRRATELAPNDPEAHREFGNLLFGAGRFEDARGRFAAYWNAVSALTAAERPDKDLLLVDAAVLSATCYRNEESPDKERSELEAALEIAEQLSEKELKPHAVRARVLELLAENAFNGRRSPLTGKGSGYFDRCASEFRLAGQPADAERVLRRKAELLKAAAAA